MIASANKCKSPEFWLLVLLPLVFVDEGLEPTCVSPLNNTVLCITGIKAGPKAGPNLSLGELTCRLIERWDGMSDEERRAFEFLADLKEELAMVNAD